MMPINNSNAISGIMRDSFISLSAENRLAQADNLDFPTEKQAKPAVCD